MSESNGTQPTPPQVFQLLAESKRRLPAIGKGGYNSQQNFAFRGIEDLVNVLGPILDDLGLVIIPDARERVTRERTSKQGGTMYEVSLHVDFTVWAPDGSWIKGSAWGEGVDSMDKATNKAHTGAFKNFITEAWNVATKEMAASDPDRTAPSDDPDVTRDPFVCDECDKAGSHYEHLDRDKFRNHLVTKHGYERLDDGRARKPVSRDPGPDPAPKEEPDHVERPVDPPKVDGPEETKDTGTRAATKPDAKPQAAKGRRASPAPTASTPTPPPSEPSDGWVDPVDVPSSQFEDVKAYLELGDDLFVEGTEEIACPEDGCDVFPFMSEGAYNVHWYAAHDPDTMAWLAPRDAVREERNRRRIPAAPDDPAPSADDPAPSAGTSGDTTPAAPEHIAQIKEMVGKLKGDGARAYARYRRENGLPRPEDQNLDQAMSVIDFLSELVDA